MINLDNLRIEYRETITKIAPFNARFIRQSCCPGRYAHIIGRIEPCPEEFVFKNQITDDSISPEFIPACEEGFKEAMKKGKLAGYPVRGVKVIVEGGSEHPVDSNHFCFQLAAMIAFRNAFLQAEPVLLEPIMRLQVQIPSAYQERVKADLLQRLRVKFIEEIEMDEEINYHLEIPMAQIIGYEADLQQICHGQGSFAREFYNYVAVPPELQQEMSLSWLKYKDV